MTAMNQGIARATIRFLLKSRAKLRLFDLPVLPDIRIVLKMASSNFQFSPCDIFTQFFQPHEVTLA
jgi:hypothetical protein